MKKIHKVMVCQGLENIQLVFDDSEQLNIFVDMVFANSEKDVSIHISTYREEVKSE